MVVDRRIGAAAGRAGERDRLRPRPAPSDEELGARADERRLGRADAEAVARGKELAQRAEERGRDRAPAAPRRAPRAPGRPSGARRRGCARRRGRPRRSYADGSAALCDTHLADRRGVEHRKRLVGERGEAGAKRRERARPDRLPGASIAAAVRKVRSAVARDRELGQDEQRRRKRRPVRRAAAVLGESEASDPHRPRAGGQARRLVRRCDRAGRRRSPRERSAKRPGPARDRLGSGAEAGEREPAIGLLPGEPAVRGQPRGDDRADGIARARPRRSR